MTIPKKLLVLTYNFPPWGGGASIRIRKFVKYLLRLDWEIHVVTIRESYLDPAAPTDPDTLKDVEGCRIHRTGSLEPSTRYKNAIRQASGLAPDGSTMQEKGIAGKGIAFL